MADQRKRTTSGSGKARSRSAAAKKGQASRTKGSRSASAKKASASKSQSTRRASASKAGKASGRKRTAAKGARRAGEAAAPAAEFSGKSVAELRDALSRNLFRPLEMVLLTRDRIQEVVDDAVRRGRMTADDAEEVVRGLVERGRRQTDDVLSNLEGLLDRSGSEVRRRAGAAGRARKQVEDAAGRARKRAAGAADPVIAQADRVRRAAGVGPNFPISGYDELTAAQVQGRLGSLTPAELRKVRDYERRNANRKSVLSAIETKLS